MFRKVGIFGRPGIFCYRARSAEICARHQREAHLVQGLDHDLTLGYNIIKMLAWGFSKNCSGGHPGQSEIQEIAQLINHHKMKTNCGIRQTKVVFRILA